MRDIQYDVIKYDEVVESFTNKEEAINYAISNKCHEVIKFDNFNFEPLGIVWNK